MSAKTHMNTLGSNGLSEKDRENFDFYQTPAYAIKTLVQRFDFKSKLIWEPMAGNGMISHALKDAGYDVYSTDIVERNYKLNDTIDYFDVNNFTASDDFSIVTNPPYEYANKFLKHTLETIKPKTCSVFLPIRYLEGMKRYEEIYSKFKPCKVFVYAKRLGCFTEKDLSEGKVNEYGIGSAVAYMWLCFDRDTWNDQQSTTEMQWIS